MTDDAQIADLIAALDRDDKPALRGAVDALIALASKSEGVKNRLHQRLIEDGHRHYWPVAYILAQLKNPPRQCMDALIDGLDHREADIRWAIALLLVRLAKENGAVVDRLIDLSARGTANQKRMALYCLRDLALADPQSLAAMFGALKDGDPTVRVAAAISLKARPDLDEERKKNLLWIYLRDVDPKVRHAAVITLASVGAPSEEFLQALNAARNSEDPQTRKAAGLAFEILKNERSASCGGPRRR